MRKQIGFVFSTLLVFIAGCGEAPVGLSLSDKAQSAETSTTTPLTIDPSAADSGASITASPTPTEVKSLGGYIVKATAKTKSFVGISSDMGDYVPTSISVPQTEAADVLSLFDEARSMMGLEHEENLVLSALPKVVGDSGRLAYATRQIALDVGGLSGKITGSLMLERNTDNSFTLIFSAKIEGASAFSTYLSSYKGGSLRIAQLKTLRTLIQRFATLKDDSAVLVILATQMEGVTLGAQDLAGSPALKSSGAGTFLEPLAPAQTCKQTSGGTTSVSNMEEYKLAAPTGDDNDLCPFTSMTQEPCVGLYPPIGFALHATYRSASYLGTPGAAGAFVGVPVRVPQVTLNQSLMEFDEAAAMMGISGRPNLLLTDLPKLAGPEGRQLYFQRNIVLNTAKILGNFSIERNADNTFTLIHHLKVTRLSEFMKYQASYTGGSVKIAHLKELLSLFTKYAKIQQDQADLIIETHQMEGLAIFQSDLGTTLKVRPSGAGSTHEPIDPGLCFSQTQTYVNSVSNMEEY